MRPEIQIIYSLSFLIWLRKSRGASSLRLVRFKSVWLKILQLLQPFWCSQICLKVTHQPAGPLALLFCEQVCLRQRLFWDWRSLLSPRASPLLYFKDVFSEGSSGHYIACSSNTLQFVLTLYLKWSHGPYRSIQFTKEENSAFGFCLWVPAWIPRRNIEASLNLERDFFVVGISAPTVSTVFSLFWMALVPRNIYFYVVKWKGWTPDKRQIKWTQCSSVDLKGKEWK